MMYLQATLWAEFLKARRSKMPGITALGFLLIPLALGLFMYILKDPESARSMGIISVKAQIAVGVADWPTLLNVLIQALAGGGAVLFALVTSWVFGREFSDHTAKDLLALPAPREATVLAKFAVIMVWAAGLAVEAFVLGIAVSALVGIPGWSEALAWQAAASAVAVFGLTLATMPMVALFASIGRGYLAPMGWMFLTMAFGQLAVVLGWGSWFPWSVAMLLAAGGSRAADIGAHSIVAVALVCVLGIAGTLAWWRYADQTR